MERYNVIIIALDALRSDRIHVSPDLLDISRNGYFFPNMITTAPYSLVSFHSMITGLYPSKHGVDSYFSMFKFKKNLCKTLTQYLQENGYYTESNLYEDSVLPKEGFDKFSIQDSYNENEYNKNLIKLHKKIISKAKNKNFFLFLLNNLLHIRTIAKIGKKTDFDLEYFNNYELNKKNYNIGVKELGFYIFEIYNHIKNLGLLDKTIIIFLSDHGMSNGEKLGEKMYGSFTYDYTIKVFCSFIMPKTKGKQIDFQTRTIDIMPTILEILKIKADESYEHLQGRSLVPLINGKEKEDRVTFSETGGLKGPWPSSHKHNVFCVRLKKWKLIYNKTPDTWEMYNLENDSEEKKNIFDKNKNEDLTLKLQKMLLDHIKSNDENSIYESIT